MSLQVEGIKSNLLLLRNRLWLAHRWAVSSPEEQPRVDGGDLLQLGRARSCLPLAEVAIITNGARVAKRGRQNALFAMTLRRASEWPFWRVSGVEHVFLWFAVRLWQEGVKLHFRFSNEG